MTSGLLTRNAKRLCCLHLRRRCSCLVAIVLSVQSNCSALAITALPLSSGYREDAGSVSAYALNSCHIASLILA